MSDPFRPARPWLLAIDTSTDWAGIALTDGVAVAELNWLAGRRQTVQILAEVERLLATVGAGTVDIGAVCVALGPGSFSGLRVGLSIAKGMAIASDVAVIGISTLAATIDSLSGLSAPVVAVVKAGRARYVWATAELIEAPESGTFSDLVTAIRSLPQGAIVLGEVGEADLGELVSATGCVVPAAPGRFRRAGVLAHMGYERWSNGLVDDVITLEPHYLHLSATKRP